VNYMRLLIVVLFLFVISPVSAETVRFLQSIPELPLPQGASENMDAAVLFDAPNGRFVQVELQLQGIDSTSVISYYQALLPSLGWQEIENNEFLKGNERLKVFPSDSDKENRIMILLEPR